MTLRSYSLTLRIFIFCLVRCISTATNPISLKASRNQKNIQDVFVSYLQPNNQPNLQVKISETKENGFCLVAKRDFKVGEIVLLDIPVVSWCYDPKESRCSHCQKPLIESSSLCKCNNCLEKYCCSLCQQNAECYHKPLCSLSSNSSNSLVLHREIEKFAMKTYAKNREDGYISLFMRLFSMAYSSDLSNPLDIPAISILESKAILPSVSSNSNNPKSSVNTMDKFLRSVDYLFAEKLGELYQQNNTSLSSTHLLNSLYMLQYMLQHYAVLTYKGLNGLYLSASFMNHDCEPTVEIVLDPDNFNPGHVMKINALRSIKPGEEITISYIDPNMSYKNRQADLMKEYHFKCRCKRCEREDTTTSKKSVVTNNTKPTTDIKLPSTGAAVTRIRSLRQVKRPPSS